MDLLKISDRNYIPIYNIIRIGRDGDRMYVYYQRGGTTDYHSTNIRDGHTLEQELQSRLVNILPTKGFVNAI